MSSDMVTVKMEEESQLLACRICLAWDFKLYHIRESGLDQAFSELMGTSPEAPEGLPQHLCSWCQALLLKASELRRRCRRADALLMQALTQEQVITNSYIHTIDRSTHNLNHLLSKNLETYVKYFYEDTQTNMTYPNIKVETEPDENQSNSKNDEDGNKNEEKEDMLPYVGNHSDDTGDSDEDETMSLPEQKYKTEPDFVDVDVMLDEVKLEPEINKSPKRSPSKGTLQIKKLQNVKNNMKATTQVKHKGIAMQNKTQQNVKNNIKATTEEKNKEKTRSELGIEEFVKKYNFEVQYLTEKEMLEDMEARRLSDRYENFKFKCKLCHYGFLTSATLEKHMKKQHNPRYKYKCRLCHMNFLFEFHIIRHAESSHRARLRCRVCGVVVWARSECSPHAAHHSGTGKQCKHCGQSFRNHSTYAWHMRVAHPVENSAQGTCELCGEIFGSAWGLVLHKRLTHGIKKATPELQCGRCRTQFDNKQALRTHARQQRDDECDPNISPCARCGAGLESPETLLRHTHHAHGVDIFTCDQCNTSFLSKASLTTHVDRMHRGIKPLQQPHKKTAAYKQTVVYKKRERKCVCEHCGKEYTNRTTHMLTHATERPHRCDRCPKAFVTTQQLQCHIRTHTGERPYQCDQCPMAFSAQNNLNRHRKTVHMGERPYSCDICHKTFTTSAWVKAHVQYVHMNVKAPPRKRRRINKTD